MSCSDSKDSSENHLSRPLIWGPKRARGCHLPSPASLTSHNPAFAPPFSLQPWQQNSTSSYICNSALISHVISTQKYQQRLLSNPSAWVTQANKSSTSISTDHACLRRLGCLKRLVVYLYMSPKIVWLNPILTSFQVKTDRCSIQLRSRDLKTRTLILNHL